MPISNISGASASAPRSIYPDVASSALSENLHRAANVEAPTRAAVTSTIVEVSSKDAYSHLQRRASEACFSNNGLSELVFRNAQKSSLDDKNSSALALLDCAVNVQLIRTSGLVSQQALKPVEKALQHLAERFQKRPSRSMVGYDPSHSTRHYDYKALIQKIDKLLSEAPGGSDKVFDNINLQLISAYSVDSLLGRGESDEGQLSAQGPRFVMENGNLTEVTGRVLNLPMKWNKAEGNGQSLGFFIRHALSSCGPVGVMK